MNAQAQEIAALKQYIETLEQELEQYEAKQENIVHMAITRAQAQEYARQLDELASDPATYSQMAPLLNEIEDTYGDEGMEAVAFQGKLNKMKRRRDEMDKEAIEAVKRYDQKQAERWNNLFSS